MDDSGFVVTRIRDSESNLRTTFLKIIKRAGLKPWPKLFQNLRASRQTELQEIYPTHVVCSWMGNSPKVAQKHYLQGTDEHFEKAVQNPLQQASRDPEIPSQIAAGRNEETPKNAESQHFPGFKDSGGGIRNSGQNVGKTVSLGGSAVKSAVTPVLGGATWGEIRALIEACDDLTPAARRKLITLGDKGQL